MNNVKGLKGMILCALFAALMAVCSWITIPYVVPFTMQTFAVFVALDLLGWRGTLITVLVYMALGAVGLPVFSGFSGGVSHLIGPTGGYIVGFAAMAAVYGLTVHFAGESRKAKILGMVLGLITCYAFGTVWFVLVYSAQKGAVSVLTALSWCVFPYILPDLVKMALAFLLSERVAKSLKNR